MYWAGAGGYFPQLDRVPPLCWGRPWASQVSRGQGRWEVREGKRCSAVAEHRRQARARGAQRGTRPSASWAPSWAVRAPAPGTSSGFAVPSQWKPSLTCLAVPMQVAQHQAGSRALPRGSIEAILPSAPAAQRCVSGGSSPRLPPVTWDRIASLEWEGAALECAQS